MWRYVGLVLHVSIKIMQVDRVTHAVACSTGMHAKLRNVRREPVVIRWNPSSIYQQYYLQMQSHLTSVSADNCKRTTNDGHRDRADWPLRATELWPRSCRCQRVEAMHNSLFNERKCSDALAMFRVPMRRHASLFVIKWRFQLRQLF